MNRKAASQLPRELEEARELFVAWRDNPNRVRKIPVDRWSVAVSLCGRHSICTVSKALRLSYKDIRTRVQEKKMVMYRAT